MTRFAWAAWGLLVVVLDLPLLGWDALPDVVGYAWVVIGLAGGPALHPAFARARAAAAAGVPVAVITGTPLFVDLQGVVWGALFTEVLVSVVLLHQLATGVRELAPEGDSDERRWAKGVQVGALAAGGVKLVGLVGYFTAVGLLYPLGVLGLVVVGIIAVVLLHRVNRAGWLATASPSATATPADPPAPA